MVTTVSVEELQDLTEQGYLSVGFSSSTGLEELEKLLKRLILNKKTPDAKFFTQLNKETTKLSNIIEETTETAEQLEFELENLQKKLKSTNEEFVDQLKKSSKSLKDLKDNIDDTIGDITDELESKLFKGFQVALKMYNGMYSAGEKFVEVHRQLESSGISVRDGFEGLRNISYQTGMSLEQISKIYSKSSQTIAKFNTSTGKGVETFTKMINGIDDNLNFTADERSALLNSFMEGRSALEQNFDSPEFQKAFEQYYKNMKLMSIATGKTVENLVEEQKLKDNSRVGQTFKMTHKTQANALGSLGLSEELEAYIISGGVKNVKEATLAMANSPIMKELLPALLAKGATNLDQDYVTGLKERVSGLANAERNRLTSNVQNLGMATAGYMSDDFARMNFDTYGLQLAETGKNVSNAREILEDKDNKQSKAIKSQSDINREKNRLETEATYAKSGGTENWIKATDASTTALKGLTETLHFTNTLLEKNGLWQFAGSVAANSIGFWGPALLNKGVGKYAKSEAHSKVKSLGGKAKNNFTKAGGWKGAGLKAGVGLIGAGIDGFSSDIADMVNSDKNSTTNKAIDYGASILGGAASGASTGALIGSFLGPIGTAVGAGIGGIIGGTMSYFDTKNEREALETPKQEELKSEEQQNKEASLNLQKEQVELTKETNALLVEMIGTEKANAIISKMKTNSYTNNQTNYI